MNSNRATPDFESRFVVSMIPLIYLQYFQYNIEYLQPGDRKIEKANILVTP